MATTKRRYTSFGIASGILSAAPMSTFIERKIERHLKSMTGVLSRRLLILHASQFKAGDQFLIQVLFALRSIPFGKERLTETEVDKHVRNGLMHDLKGLRGCFGLKIRKLIVLTARDLKHALELLKDLEDHREPINPGPSTAANRDEERLKSGTVRIHLPPRRRPLANAKTQLGTEKG